MKKIINIASVIFGIVSLAHLLRLVFGVSVIIGNFILPMWVSIIGFLATMILSIFLWKESEKNS